MRFFILILFSINLFASLDEINSFEADFIQKITDEQNKTITYYGHMMATKPDNARWIYNKPVKKDVFMNIYNVTIVESELEQVIVKKVESNFDFFKMIKNAKKLNDNTYSAKYHDTTFNIVKKGEMVLSISYKDEFENRVIIEFKNQVQNKKIDEKLFIPTYPLEYDIVGE